MARPAQQARTRDPRGGGGGGPAAQKVRPAVSQQNAGGISPRSMKLIAGVSEVLQPLNYTEADIHALVKKCNYDSVKIQEQVFDILEGAGGWATTEGKEEKASKAAEAKNRRLQREKEMAEEAKRVSEERTKKEDEKFRRMQEEIKSRKAKEKAALLGGPGSADGAKEATTRTWRTNDEAQAEQQPPPQQQQPKEEEPEEDHEAAEEAEAEQHWMPRAGGAPSAPSRWQPKVQAESWGEETGNDGGSNAAAWTEPSASVPEAPMPTMAPAPAISPCLKPSVPAAAAALAADDPVLSSEHVQMPPSYAALLGSGHEPQVWFGCLHVDDVSSLPALPAEEALATASEAPQQRPGRQRQERPARSEKWVPRGGNGEAPDSHAKDGDAEEQRPEGRKGGRKGRNPRADSAADHADAEGEGGASGKERKEGKGKGKGWKRSGKSEEKGEGKSDERGGGDGKKGEAKGKRKGGRREDWQDGRKGGKSSQA